jgi:hypothetical protein
MTAVAWIALGIVYAAVLGAGCRALYTGTRDLWRTARAVIQAARDQGDIAAWEHEVSQP